MTEPIVNVMNRIKESTEELKKYRKEIYNTIHKIIECDIIVVTPNQISFTIKGENYIDNLIEIKKEFKPHKMTITPGMQKIIVELEWKWINMKTIEYLESLTGTDNFVFKAYDNLIEPSEIKQFHDEYIEWFKIHGDSPNKAKEIVRENITMLLGWIPQYEPQALVWKKILEL